MHAFTMHVRRRSGEEGRARSSLLSTTPRGSSSTISTSREKKPRAAPPCRPAPANATSPARSAASRRWATLALVGWVGSLLLRSRELDRRTAALELALGPQLCELTYSSVALPGFAECQARDSHGHTHRVQRCPEDCRLLIDQLFADCTDLSADLSAERGWQSLAGVRHTSL